MTMTRLQLWQNAPQRWQPAINAFRCESGICICVELAGIDRSQIDLTVESLRVMVRGTREAPEPADDQGRAVQMLALEIDYGPFEREVILPAPVDVEGASAEQRNGLLWIHLPFEK